MARAHLFRSVTDDKGNLLYGAEVTARQINLSDKITQTIYAGPLGDAAVLENPFVIDGGYIDVWLDSPERVNFLVDSPGRDPMSVYLDVNTPAPEQVRSLYPLVITNQPADGKVLIGDGPDTASFQNPPTVTAGAVPAHDHDGGGVDSTRLGTGASAEGVRSTAIGDQAVANFSDSTALGYQAAASATGATAAGNAAQALGVDATAVGRAARADTGSTAVGRDSIATGTRATALGLNASAAGAGALAVGSASSASGQDSVALGKGAAAIGAAATAIGSGASAPNARSVALGAGAATTEDDQIVLGAPGTTTLALGDLRALDSAHVAGATSTLGFFGAAGATKQVVTGSDGGDLVLRTLLSLLAAHGLIDNQTTGA